MINLIIKKKLKKKKPNDNNDDSDDDGGLNDVNFEEEILKQSFNFSLLKIESSWPGKSWVELSYLRQSSDESTFIKSSRFDSFQSTSSYLQAYEKLKKFREMESLHK